MLGAADRRSSGRVLPPRRLGAFLTGVSGFMAVLRGSLVKEECAGDRGIDGVEAPAVPGRESRSAAGQPLDGYRSYRGWRGQRHVRRADHRVAADTARPDDGRWRGHLGRQPARLGIQSGLPPVTGYATSELSINMVRRVPDEGQLVARGRLVHLGRRLGLSEAFVTDDGGRARRLRDSRQDLVVGQCRVPRGRRQERINVSRRCSRQRACPRQG